MRGNRLNRIGLVERGGVGPLTVRICDGMGPAHPDKLSCRSVVRLGRQTLRPLESVGDSQTARRPAQHRDHRPRRPW